tara:strand:- start:412 stop:639 length:228 start_codon:yes stop_codon:yes gene_type:complete
MAGCNRMAELSAAAAGEYYYDERDYWWALMETPPDQHHKLWEQNTTMHPSANIPEVIFKNKEGSDWDYDTYGHGG